MNAVIPPELATRIAAAAAAVDGVRSAVVCTAEGALLGSAGNDEPQREASVAGFIAARAEGLPVDGDLRGMGKQLAASKFDHLAVSAPGGDSALYGLAPGSYLSVRLAPGKAAAVPAALAALVRRVAALPEPSLRSSQP